MGKEIKALITYNKVAIINRIILYRKCKKKKKWLSSYVEGLGLISRIYAAIVEPALTEHKAIIC